jgi:hypothetical protein
MRNHDGCHLDAFAVAIVSLARIRAQLGQREAALAAVKRVTALDASRRLEMLDDELLAGVW